MYIRNLVFMNGGALVAILGAMAQNHNYVEWAFGPIFFFGVGIILAAILNLKSYLKARKIGNEYMRISKDMFDNKIGVLGALNKQNNLIDHETPRDKIDPWISIGGLVCFVFGFFSGIYHLT